MAAHASATRKWRNWQTRRLQVPVSLGTWGFKSPLAHKCDVARHRQGLNPRVQVFLCFGSSAGVSKVRILSGRYASELKEAPSRLAWR